MEGMASDVGGVSEVVVKVNGTEDIQELRGKGVLKPSLGSLRPSPNDARIRDGEVDRDAIGKAIDQRGKDSKEIRR